MRSKIDEIGWAAIVGDGLGILVDMDKRDTDSDREEYSKRK